MSGTFVRSCSWAKVVVFRLLHGTGHDLGQIDAFFPACTRHFAGTRAAEAERHGHGGMKTAAAMMRAFPEKIFL